MKANELIPNPANPRRITDEKLEALKASMKEFGDMSGVVRNLTTGNLVGGHQRVKILAETEVTITTKYKKPSKVGTVAEGYVEHDGEKFIYREVKWDKTKETAAMIAANKHGGEWDLPLLKEILSELDTGEFDMNLTGFSETELEELMTAAPPMEQGKNDAYTEWAGMPEFEQENLLAKRFLKVNFLTDENFFKFAKLIKQTLTFQTRSMVSGAAA